MIELTLLTLLVLLPFGIILWMVSIMMVASFFGKGPMK